MTDTITVDTVDRTITALGITLQRTTERLATEEAEYVEKRDRMVTVAHRRGTENSIGTALDDLLEEFGLPRRPERAYLRALLMVSAPLNRSHDHVQTDTGQYIYWQEGVRVQFPVALDWTANVPDGEECICAAPVDAVREWMLSYYGAHNVASMQFQIGRCYCGVDACPNRQGAEYPNTSQAARIDWGAVSLHPAVEPQPVPA